MVVRRTLVLFSLCLASLNAQNRKDISTHTPLKPGDTLIVGFLGAWEHWHDTNRGVRKLALRLRQTQGPAIHVETFANHRRSVALKFIRRALDHNRDGVLDSAERASLHIILYGQSLGGGAVVKLARELELMDVPVELTIQVDSVGLKDSVIPANVRFAANFYQEELFTIRGESQISAADPLRTRIIANIRWSPIEATEAPETWLRRRFGGAHALMEADPQVWSRVEGWILGAIGPPGHKI